MSRIQGQRHRAVGQLRASGERRHDPGQRQHRVVVVAQIGDVRVEPVQLRPCGAAVAEPVIRDDDRRIPRHRGRRREARREPDRHRHRCCR